VNINTLIKNSLLIFIHYIGKAIKRTKIVTIIKIELIITTLGVTFIPLDSSLKNRINPAPAIGICASSLFFLLLDKFYTHKQISLDLLYKSNDLTLI